MTDTACYDIDLRIGYDYDHPAGSNRTLLRMQPLVRPGQQVLGALVSVEPRPDFRLDRQDFFGNAVTEVGFDRPIGRVAFRYRGRVRVSAPDSALDLSCGLAGLAGELAAQGGIEPDAPHHFLGASPRVRPAPDFDQFTASALAGPEKSAFASARAICDAIHAAFDFDPTATDVTTPPIEAFRARRGVCQDISHVAIACLRAAGIPAAYVSGLLKTLPPPGQPRLEGADAMHAWVRAWCGGEMGWVEIDPTNAMVVGADHVAVAIGRDYSDVAPVKGTLRSVGGHRTSQQVDVIPLA